MSVLATPLTAIAALLASFDCKEAQQFRTKISKIDGAADLFSIITSNLSAYVDELVNDITFRIKHSLRTSKLMADAALREATNFYRDYQRAYCTKLNKMEVLF